MFETKIHARKIMKQLGMFTQVVQMPPQRLRLVMPCDYCSQVAGIPWVWGWSAWHHQNLHSRMQA
jgi:hypothetical protein